MRKFLGQRKSGAGSWELGLRQGMAVVGADPPSAQGHMASSYMGYISYVDIHGQLASASPLLVEDFMILSLFSESPDFSEMCLHIYF